MVDALTGEPITWPAPPSSPAGARRRNRYGSRRTQHAAG